MYVRHLNIQQSIFNDIRSPEFFVWDVLVCYSYMVYGITGFAPKVSFRHYFRCRTGFWCKAGITRNNTFICD